jgi:tetratricopeptide (TPR) repeat protein
MKSIKKVYYSFMKNKVINKVVFYVLCFFFFIPLHPYCSTSSKSQTQSSLQNTSYDEVTIFITAESKRNEKKWNEAYALYRNLARNLLDDGDSALSSVATWHLIRMFQTEIPPTSEDIKEIHTFIQSLKDSRQLKGITSRSFLGSIPQLKKEIFLEGAKLARRNHQNDIANALFWDYLWICGNFRFNDEESRLLTELEQSSLVPKNQLYYKIGQRARMYGHYEISKSYLSKLQSSENPYYQHRAYLELGLLNKNTQSAEKCFNHIITNSNDNELLQEAMYQRAMLYNSTKNRRLFTKLMENLIETYPTGHRTDDALYQLARRYKRDQLHESSLKYYARLRMIETNNDWKNSACFYPFIDLYGDQKKNTNEQCNQILSKLLTPQYESPFYIKALFWMGRLAEEKGDKKLAKSYFQRIVTEFPYHYYAIRARMHLQHGVKAKSQTHPDESILAEIKRAYTNSAIDTEIDQKSSHHKKLKEALSSKQYKKALTDSEIFKQKTQEININDRTLNELVQIDGFSEWCILLSLRQEALAAISQVNTAQNRLAIVGAIGTNGGDWPFALAISQSQSLQLVSKIQNDPRYLATSYPPIFKNPILTYAKKYSVNPALLYSVMRKESVFYPYAVSIDQALGLFQFTPWTYRALNKRWKFNRRLSMHEYLCNANNNIYLGAKWFSQELLKRQKGVIPYAIMEHNAGYPAVKTWKNKWLSQKKSDDWEYMLDSIPFRETREFTQNVLTDMWIVEAIGLLDKK